VNKNLPPLSPADVITLGLCIYGSRRFKTALARALGVSPRLVHYWLAGRCRVPHGHAKLILLLYKKRHDRRVIDAYQEFRAVADSLPSWAKAALLIAGG